MKTIYWTSTLLIVVFLILSAYSYFFNKNTIDGIKSLGFPDFFRIQLAVLKLVAAVILTFPIFSIQFKEWAYAGVGLFLITALLAHIKLQDSVFILILLGVLLGILAISNYFLPRNIS
jgi:hypothetical protein